MKKLAVFAIFLICFYESGYTRMGDGLGNHKATKDLNMNNNAMIEISSISFIDGNGQKLISYLGEFGTFLVVSKATPAYSGILIDNEEFDINAKAALRLIASADAGATFLITSSSSVDPPANTAIILTDAGLTGGLIFAVEADADIQFFTNDAESPQMKINSTGIISNVNLNVAGYTVSADSYVITGSGEKFVLSYVPSEYAMRISTNLNIAGNQLTFGDGERQVGCDGDDICITNGNEGGNISFDVSAVSTTVKIKDVLNLNPISAPPIDDMPEGSVYCDSDTHLVYLATSSVNSTMGSGWINLLTQVTVAEAHAEIYIDTATETSITANVYRSIAGDYTDGIINDFTFSGGTLTYTGTIAKRFDGFASGCITAPGATEAHWKFAKNGVVIDKTQQCLDMPNNDMRNIAITGFIDLEQNDKIAVYVTTSDGTNLTHDTLLFKLVEVKQ